MPTDFMKKVIVPLMMTGAVNFWITTIDEAENMINTVVDNIKSGKINFVKLMQHSLACDLCKNMGIATKCTHKVIEHPKWNNPKSIEKIKLLMNDDDAFMRETMGLSAMEQSERAFPEPDVKRLMNADKLNINDIQAKFVYISVDPAAGGKGSKYAIISTSFIKQRLVILGIDQIRSKKPDENDALLIKHISTIRNIRSSTGYNFANSKIVLIIEANLGFEHYRIANILTTTGIDYIRLNEHNGNFGIYTTPMLKGKMVDQFKLGLARDNFVFSKGFFTNSLKAGDVPYAPDEIIMEFCTQLLNFEKRYKYKTNNERQPDIIFTGKGTNKCDDLVMAMLLNEEGRARFESNRNGIYSKV